MIIAFPFVSAGTQTKRKALKELFAMITSLALRRGSPIAIAAVRLSAIVLIRLSGAITCGPASKTST